MTKYVILSWFLCIYSLAYADSTMVPAGAVSGIWLAIHSPYLVGSGNITVNDGDTLRIFAGVVVKFTGPYQLAVNGVLRATGTPTSLVRFTADTVANPAGWKGIRFTSARDSNRLSYCIVENVRTTGTPDGNGAVVHVGSHRLSLDHVTFQRNRAAQTAGAYMGTGSGGALFSACNFNSNSAGVNGGAMYLSASSPSTFMNCDFVGNTAGLGNANGRSGGAVDCWQASGSFTSCSFVRNHCAGLGGAVNGHGMLSFDSCNFDSNRAEQHGGGLYFDDSLSTFSLTNCQIRWNSAAIFAGGLFCFDASPLVMNCQIIGNSSGGRGGGINCYRWSLTAHFENCLISQNTCANEGGGIWMATYCHPTFSNCEISWNTARTGGGFYSTNHGNPSFSHCRFLHNTVTEDGGGMSLNQYSVCTLDTSTISWNTAAGDGGGMIANGSFFSVNSCSLSYNTARNGGGAAIIASCANDNPVMISNGIVKGNRADSSGGGFYLLGASCPGLERLLVLDNIAGAAGGGMSCDGSAVPAMNRCDVLRNQAPVGAGIFTNASSPVVSTTTVAANVGSGLDLQVSPGSQIRFCDIYDNSSGNIMGNSFPAGLGLVDRSNVNGNPCDVWSNIYLNPLLQDTATGNYLPAVNSPCLDAGDSLLTCDADMTVPEIGAVTMIRDASAVVPQELVIAALSPTSAWLRWRRPIHICLHAPIVYEIWSAHIPDYAFQLIGSVTDTVFTDSTVFPADSQRVYQVTWSQTTP